jgi:hypothetical protein
MLIHLSLYNQRVNLSNKGIYRTERIINYFKTLPLPLIVKRFQKNNNRILPGVEQETNSTVGLVNQVTDSFIRGGVITATQRALVDAERIGKFLLTPSGLSWIAANVALQRTNPENVTSPRNRQFTPLNIGLQVPANIAGIHFREMVL